MGGKQKLEGMWDMVKFLLHFSRDGFFREQVDFLGRGPFQASLAQYSFSLLCKGEGQRPYILSVCKTLLLYVVCITLETLHSELEFIMFIWVRI